MDQFIERLLAVGLHGRFDIDIRFSEGVNIVHGRNGTGKTTLLHILTNALNLDVARFANLTYRTIRLEIANGQVIEFFGQPSVNHDHLSDVTLRINDEEITTWPPEIPEREPERRQRLFHERLRHPRLRRHRDEIAVAATYFPAFRTMIEAWSSLNLSDLARQGPTTRRRVPPATSRQVPHPRRSGFLPGSSPTTLARQVFGGFVPPINYPSPREIEQELDRAIQRAINRLASEDRSLFSNAFTRVFDAISQAPESDLLDSRTSEAVRFSISQQLDKLQATEREYGLLDSNSAFQELKAQLSTSGTLGKDHDEVTTIRILKVYEEALSQRVEFLTDAFRTVREYIDAVNTFLEGKQLITASQDVESTPRLHIQHEEDPENLNPLDTLSSGERQVVGLIYSASYIAEGNVILVDEPELSLHIDWQREIIDAMMQQLPSKQLIISTHSPIIASNYRGSMIELVPKPTKWIREVKSEEIVEDVMWSEVEEFEDI